MLKALCPELPNNMRASVLDSVTPLVLTYNEEANIGRVLQELAWAREVVVVDSFSTDDTIRLLGNYPQVVVHQRMFDNHVAQWNYGLAQVRTPWVLSLDADYVLSKGFETELAGLIPASGHAGYYASFVYCVAGRPLRGSLYPPRIVLFRRDCGWYLDDGHTQLLHLDGSAGRLRSPIFHDDRKPLQAWLTAQRRYAELEANKLRSTPKSGLGLYDRMRTKMWLMPLLTPLYCLLAKGLILNGLPGLFYTGQRTYAELLLSLCLMDSELSRFHGPNAVDRRFTVTNQSRESAGNIPAELNTPGRLESERSD